jgi:hypothetical protein
VKRPTDKRPCDVCGTPFAPRRGGKRQKYCGVRCRRKVIRAGMAQRHPGYYTRLHREWSAKNRDTIKLYHLRRSLAADFDEKGCKRSLRWYYRNADAVNERKRAATGEDREKMRAANKQWYWRNVEEQRERCRRKYWRDPEKRRAAALRYYHEKVKRSEK